MTRTYWMIRKNDSYEMSDHLKYPELRQYYPTAEHALVAAEAALRRLAEEYEQRVADANARHPPEAARKAWDDPARHACERETRIVECVVLRLAPDHQDRTRESRRVRLEPVVDTRLRFRESRMMTKINKDGTTEITYALAKPGVWSEWKRDHGGVYLPVVELEAYPVEQEWGCTAEELVAWAQGGGA